MTTPTRESTEHVFTYLANARYHVTDNSTMYVRYATGYRPGGPNFVLNDPATGLPVGPPTFQADRLRSYEAGFKAQTDDQRFAMDVAAYYIDWNNIHIAVAKNSFSGIENAGGATVRGAELTLTARPVRDLTLTGAFAWQDAKLSQDAPDLGAQNGDNLPNVPRFTAAVSGDYTVPVAMWLPTVGATVKRVTERNASFDHSLAFAQYRLPAYTTVDLRAGKMFGAVNLMFYVHNLFDERGELSAFSAYSAPGDTKVSILQPRTVGLTATTRF